MFIRGGEINCPCCPSRTFVAQDKTDRQTDRIVYCRKPYSFLTNINIFTQSS